MEFVENDTCIQGGSDWPTLYTAIAAEFEKFFLKLDCRRASSCARSNVQRCAKCRFQLVNRIDERIRFRAVDADDAVQPGGHRHRFDDNGNEAAFSVAHIEDFADD